MTSSSSIPKKLEKVSTLEAPDAGSWKSLPEDLAWIDYDHYEQLREARQRATAEGEGIVDLSMINPDLAPPRFCLDKLSEAIVKSQYHRYSVARGIRKLREAFAAKYAHRFGVKFCADSEVCVASGTKDALLHGLRVVCSAGDKILMGSPTYPLFRSAAMLTGLQAVYFSLSQDEDLMFSNLVEALRAERPRVLLLNFPNNPTGISVSRDFYERLLPVVRSLGVFVLHDFVYGELGFNGQQLPSLMSVEGFKDRALEIYSLSKAYSLPGWRIGAALGSSAVIRNISQLKTHSDYGAFLPLQYAAAATLSLRSDLVGPILQSYQTRCKLLCDGLAKLGFTVSAPTAGACVWARVPDRLQDNEEAGLKLALDSLQQVRTLVTPGGIFGKDWSQFVRIAAVRNSDELGTYLSQLAEIVQ